VVGLTGLNADFYLQNLCALLRRAIHVRMVVDVGMLMERSLRIFQALISALSRLAKEGGRRQTAEVSSAALRERIDVPYEAPIQIWDERKGEWLGKARASTFFPRSWSQARIEYELVEAFQKRKMLDDQKWQGVSPGGLIIEGFTSAKRTTFYPVL
jgi:hypothetical protein